MCHPYRFMRAENKTSLVDVGKCVSAPKNGVVCLVLKTCDGKPATEAWLHK